MTDLGELVAAVPVLLGFHPARSLTVLLMKDRRVVVTVRSELPESAESAERYADHLVRKLTDADLEAGRAALVAIDQQCHDRTTEPDPHLAAAPTLFSYAFNRTAWAAVLRGHDGTRPVAPSIAPARNTNFAGLAPAYIEVGEMDIFRDEDVGYARQLWRAGVSTELHVHPGCHMCSTSCYWETIFAIKRTRSASSAACEAPISRINVVGALGRMGPQGYACAPAQGRRLGRRLPRLGTNVQRPVPEVYRTDIVSALSRPGRGGRCRRPRAGHSGLALPCQRRDARGLLPARPGPPQCSSCTASPTNPRAGTGGRRSASRSQPAPLPH
jgi:hypothetical protein